MRVLSQPGRVQRRHPEVGHGQPQPVLACGALLEVAERDERDRRSGGWWSGSCRARRRCRRSRAPVVAGRSSRGSRDLARATASSAARAGSGPTRPVPGRRQAAFSAWASAATRSSAPAFARPTASHIRACSPPPDGARLGRARTDATTLQPTGLPCRARGRFGHADPRRAKRSDRPGQGC